MKGEDFPSQFREILDELPEAERSELAGWILSNVSPTFSNLWTFWKNIGPNVQMVLAARIETGDFERAGNVELIFLERALKDKQNEPSTAPKEKEEEDEPRDPEGQ